MKYLWLVCLVNVSCLKLEQCKTAFIELRFFEEETTYVVFIELAEFQMRQNIQEWTK